MPIEMLLGMRAAIGARDIEDLALKVDLGVRHVTASKYLMVVRSFRADHGEVRDRPADRGGDRGDSRGTSSTS